MLTVLEPYLLASFIFCYFNCKSKSTLRSKWYFNRGFLLLLVQLGFSTVFWDKGALEIKALQLHFPSSPGGPQNETMQM